MLLLCIALILPEQLKADPLVARGHAREKVGDFEGSAILLHSWLRLNQGASGAAAVFASYMHVEQDFPTLMDTGKMFIASAHGLVGAANQIMRVGRVFEIAGRLEEARDAYLSAFAEGSGDNALVGAFLLSLEMNDAKGMGKSLQDISAAGDSGAGLMKALSAYQAGDWETARSALIAVADLATDPDFSLKALWVLYQASKQRSSPDATEYRAKFASEYPGSPEAAIAVGHPDATDIRGTVVASPTPFLNASQPEQPPSTDTVPSSAPQAIQPPAPQVAQAPAKTYSVQAGSFQVKENADDLVNELTKTGFTPSVVHDMTAGKERYRVLAAAGLDVSHARDMLARLSKAGFTGLIVADK